VSSSRFVCVESLYLLGDKKDWIELSCVLFVIMI